MGLEARVRRLEAGRETAAPEACVVYADGVAIVHIYATGERLPLGEYARRWSQHPSLKEYGNWTLIEAV